MTEAPKGRPGLYAVSVLLLLGAVATLGAAARGFLDSVWLLWVSMGLSVSALGAASAAVFLRKRHG